MSRKAQLTRIDSAPRYDVLIIGGYGHVGLPLGILMADAGLQVALHDIDAATGERIAAGEMPFVEYDAEPILKRVLGRTLHLEPELEAVAHSDTVIVTVGTPLDAHMNPKVMPVLELAEAMLPHLRDGHHVMLRSTVYPGTTRRLWKFFRDRGQHVHVSMCPERIAQGYAIRELTQLPQIVSGYSPTAVLTATRLFRRLGSRTLEVAPREAELAKLFNNAWRYITFGAANQMYMMAAEAGADFDAIYRAMTVGYDRANAFPRPGFAAGPCLLKDTMQLSAFFDSNFQLGHAAMLANERMPAFIVKQLEQQIDLSRARVGILGMAFKPEVDDIRDSLSYKLGKLLRFHGGEVLYSDEYASDPTFVSKETLVQTCDVVIIATPHRAYRSMAIPRDCHVVDIWGCREAPALAERAS